MIKKTLGLLALTGLLWVGIQLETQAEPYRAIRGRNAPVRFHENRRGFDNYYPRGNDSFYYERRVIINRGGGYDDCYRCSYRSPYNHNGYYNSPRSYNRGPVFYPNSPFSIYNNRGY